MSSEIRSTADAICWERPADCEYTWFWDEYMCPVPVPSLTQSFYPYTTQAFPRNQREFWERQGTLRIMFVCGYLYVNPEMGGRPPETALARAQNSITRWEQEWFPEISANLQRLNSLPLHTMADDALARTLIDALQVTMRHWQIEGQIDGPALMAIRNLTVWYQKRFTGRPEHEPYQLLPGQSNAHLAAARKLWELTHLLTSGDQMALRAGDWNTLSASLRVALEDYLNEYGCRTEQMLDIGSPTWREDSSPVVERLLRAAEESMPDPLAVAIRVSGEADMMAGQIRSGLSDTEAAEFDALLYQARAASRAKEDHKVWIEQLTPGAVRLICSELGRRMAQSGVLQDASDVAHAYLAELIQFGFGLAQPHLSLAIAERKAMHLRNLAVRPEPWLGANPEDGEAPRATADAPEEPMDLHGRAASPGIVTGVARVLTSPAETVALRNGEILVCPWTDPDWVPLLATASAIVTDTGGVLSHAAVVAREFGLPAVVATVSATKLIRTGQLIRVDGNSGVVTLRPRVPRSSIDKKRRHRTPNRWTSPLVIAYVLEHANELLERTPSDAEAAIRSAVELYGAVEYGRPIRCCEEEGHLSFDDGRHRACVATRLRVPVAALVTGDTAVQTYQGHGTCRGPRCTEEDGGTFSGDRPTSHKRISAAQTRVALTAVSEANPRATVLIGVPAYPSEGGLRHLAPVESVSNALAGIDAGLASLPAELRNQFEGAAVYAGWTATEDDWDRVSAWHRP